MFYYIKQPSSILGDITRNIHVDFSPYAMGDINEKC